MCVGLHNNTLVSLCNCPSTTFISLSPQQAELDHLAREEDSLQQQTEECREEEQSTRGEVEEVDEQMEQVDQQLEELKSNEIDVSVSSGGACPSESVWLSLSH